MRIITKTTVIVVALLTAVWFTAVGEEGVGQQIKEGVKETGQAIKETAKTVGKEVKTTAKAVGRTTKDTAKAIGTETKHTAETVSEKSKQAWQETKAYASEDKPTYRKGARQKLNELKSEITELKSRRSEAADPQAFNEQLNTLSLQQATAEGALTRVKESAGTDDYSEARKQFDTTIAELENGIAQARKQLGG
jgi:gas vesicle protein